MKAVKSGGNSVEVPRGKEREARFLAGSCTTELRGETFPELRSSPNPMFRDGSEIAR